MRNIAVIGAGQMGTGIAQTVAANGMTVLLSDVDLAHAEAGKANVEKAMVKLMGRGKIEAADAESLLARITPVADYAPFAKADLIIEAATERETVKQAIFEDLLPPGPQGALDIRAVEIAQHAEGLHYRVLLMRGGKAIKPFVGALQFVATGHCREAGIATEQTIVLQPLLASPVPQSEAQQAALRLEFVQFQRGQGLLALPPGFAPRFVTVRVLEGGIVLASKVVAL